MNNPSSPSIASSGLALLVFILICLAVQLVGGYFTTSNLDGFYANLQKPEWTPPGKVIGIVWSILYLAMAIAAWLVWRKTGWKSLPVALFLTQLFFNFWWTMLFFQFHSPFWALVDIGFLWLMILLTIFSYYPHSMLAFGLMIPYLAWVSFASFLNYTIWRMNP